MQQRFWEGGCGRCSLMPMKVRVPSRYSVVNTEVAAQPGTHFSVMLCSTPSSLPVLRWGHITGFQQWNANGNDML